ncbi:MAG: tRNA threonylcarbamoyladenosine dehydratase [Lachnospiraceae bacterium]|nr:tRNA threonylcarbamoyladenosine dehydratase [Lachnospiraceae bacterium]
MQDQFERTRMLLGQEAMDKLRKAHVAVFGAGGVGGYIVEALVRSGVGNLDIIDKDEVSVTNLNRQIIATWDTIGRDKVDVMKERALSINPDVKVNTHKCFYLPENADEFDLGRFSYVADAVDTVTAKIELAIRAKRAKVPIISSMGTGNKLNPMQLEIADIYQTSVCPLARVMRRELRKRDIQELKVLYSKEEPIPVGNAVPGSVSFVPSAAGLMIASEIIKDIIDRK